MEWMGDAIAGLAGAAVAGAMLQGLDGRPRYVSAEQLRDGWGVVAHSQQDSSVRFRVGSQKAAEEGARKLGRELGVPAKGIDGRNLEAKRDRQTDDFGLQLF